MDKVCASPEDAVADMQDGASIAVSGFGTSYGFACSLLVAARDKGAKNLTVVSNGLGAVGQLRGMLLVDNHQVKQPDRVLLVAPGHAHAGRRADRGGRDRGRAGAAGHPGRAHARRRAPAFRPSTRRPASAHRSPRAKRVREFDGKQYVLEQAIPVDYALHPRLPRRPRWATSSSAAAARTSGRPSPRPRASPSSRSTRSSRSARSRPRASACPASSSTAWSRRPSRPTRSGPRPRRACGHAPRVQRQAGLDARRDGAPHRRPCPRRQLREPRHRHSDAGLELHRGPRHHRCTARTASSATARWSTATTSTADIFNASGQFVAINPGASFFDSVDLVRDGARRSHRRRLLGAYQVDQEGNLANYSTGDPRLGGIGGAMDLVAGKPDS